MISKATKELLLKYASKDAEAKILLSQISKLKKEKEEIFNEVKDDLLKEGGIAKIKNYSFQIETNSKKSVKYKELLVTLGEQYPNLINIIQDMIKGNTKISYTNHLICKIIKK